MSTNSTDKPSAPTRSQPGRRKFRLLPYVGAVVLLALIVFGLWPRPDPVETVRVSVGPLRATVNEDGKTRIRQRFVVSAPVAGQLHRIPLKEGDMVKAGETVVAIIDPLAPTLLDERSRQLAEARIDTAAANLAKANENYNFAASELKRFKKLSGDKVISTQELEAAQLRETSAAKEKTAAESALREAKAQLAESTGENSNHPPTEIKAPCSGRVLRIFQESARAVSNGIQLLEIGDPADLEIVIDVLSRDGAMIAPGTKVELEQWGGSKVLLARVRLIEPAAFTKVSALGVEEQRVNVIADFVTPPEQRQNIGDNFRVEAQIVVWETNEALKAPTGALFRRGEEWAAFVLAEGRAHLRPIKAGRSSGKEMQVLDGLKEGDEVILYPGDRIKDGARVTPIKI